MQKTIKTGLFILAVIAGGNFSRATTLSVIMNQEEQGRQTEVTGDWVPSEEVNTVQESDLAKEMIQEEQQASTANQEEKTANSEAVRKALQKEKAEAAAENDSHGFAITIIAMVIVVLALVILSLLFQIFGKISSSLQKSRKLKAHGVSENEKEDHHEELDSGEVIAAISMALAEHMGQGHDIEDTILTIRKLRKAYSPWNSKIYNMRTMPGHERATKQTGKTPA
ncbi:MAG: OadG family protein [Muribaculaceae bacterium]|nr:OadG family protein [Muribaculaceae bacterium]